MDPPVPRPPVPRPPVPVAPPVCDASPSTNRTVRMSLDSPQPAADTKPAATSTGSVPGDVFTTMPSLRDSGLRVPVIRIVCARGRTNSTAGVGTRDEAVLNRESVQMLHSGALLPHLAPASAEHRCWLLSSVAQATELAITALVTVMISVR
jgi:hypothetical protein